MLQQQRRCVAPGLPAEAALPDAAAAAWLAAALAVTLVGRAADFTAAEVLAAAEGFAAAGAAAAGIAAAAGMIRGFCAAAEAALAAFSRAAAAATADTALGCRKSSTSSTFDALGPAKRVRSQEGICAWHNQAGAAEI